MRDDAFRAWLAAQGMNPSSVSTRLSDARRVETHYGDLDELLADPEMRDRLLETFRYSTADAEAGRANPTTLEINGSLRESLASYRQAIVAYQRFLGIDEAPVSLSDRIRRYIIANHVEPARRRGENAITLVSGDIHREMRLENQMPTVCQVLDGQKFAEQARVRLVDRQGPERSSTVRYRFEIAAAQSLGNWALSELMRRYGEPISNTVKMMAWALPDGRQVALESSARVQIWLEGAIRSAQGRVAEVYPADRSRHSNLPTRLKQPNEASKVVLNDEQALRTLLDEYDQGKGGSRFEQLRERFLKRFPDFETGGGFAGRSEFHAEEDDYKRKLIARADELKAAHSNDPRSLGAGLVDLLVGETELESNLLGWRAAASMRRRRQAHPGVLEEAVGRAAVASDPKQALSRLVEQCWPIFEEGESSKPYSDSRTIPTALMALAHPAEIISLRTDRFNTLFDLLEGKRLFDWAPLSPGEYARAADVSAQIFEVMRDDWDWQPRDLWDVQGFIWATCDTNWESELNEMDDRQIWIVTARWGDDDGMPRFIERGEWRLLLDRESVNNRRVSEMAVGDHIFARDYFHQVHDLPFDANGGRVSAIRIRARGVITEASEDGLRVGVEWEELPEQRVWYFYTHTDPVWRLKAPGESPSADALRRFLLLGEDQDYDVFLSDPFWRDRLFGKPKVRSMMGKPSNLILYGPPGTGKTYRTAREAVRLCDGEMMFSEDQDGRAALMERYGELVKARRIEFVTFHQNFSYEDFVEGLRPTVQSDGAESSGGFELKAEPGIFRRIAERAGAPVVKTADAFSLDDRKVFKISLGEVGKAKWEWVFEDSLSEGYAIFGFKDVDWSDDRFKNRDAILEELQARYPDEKFSVQNGDVKSPDRFRNQIDVGDVLIVGKGLNAFRAIGVVEGDYEYAPRPDGRYCHRRRVRWLWDEPEGVDVYDINEKRFSLDTVYELPKSRLNVAEVERLVNSVEADEQASETSQGEREPHVLIIDEINRANISKVFGELITLLEPDKRLGQTNALTVRLPYSKKEFGVPSNLHVIGTMNTADRSIALLDTALRRRFRFEELAPDASVLPATVGSIQLRQVLNVMNQRIEYLIDRDHRIGHALFMGESPITQASVDAAMRDKVIPLLAEYFFEDWSRIASVVGDGFLEKTLLQPPPGVEGDTRESWSVRKAFLPDAYDRLLKGSLPEEGVIASEPDEDDDGE